jgi:PAS domain S-box-containing protein
MATKVQEQLERFLAQSSFPIAMLQGSEHRLLFANLGFRNLLGGREIGGQPIVQAFSPSTHKEQVETLNSVFHSGQLYESKETHTGFLQQDGSVRSYYLNLSYEPIRGEAGDIEGIFVVATDVTEQVLTREQAQGSEKYFRNLVDSSPAMIWITDENSLCTYLSQRWYEYTGRSPQKDLGIGWLENIHPADLEETAKVYAHAVENRGPLRVDYRLRKKDGSYRWAIDLGYPRFSPDGRFVGYIGTVTDVHDRLLIEHELKQTQERFSKSAQATDLGVWYCDLPFDELMWNKEVKRHFFLPPEARVTIETFYEHIHPEDRDMTRTAIQFSIDNHTPYDLVYRTVNPKRTSDIKYIRAVGWTDYGSEGTPIRFDGITLDVTRQRVIQEELKEAKRQADNANTAKSAFLANMSHEIRTPLGAILGFSELLREKNLADDERDQFLETISRNGKAVTRLIDDILDLAKVESGKLEVENVEFSFVDLIHEVIDLFEERCRAKGIYLELIKSESIPSFICSDPTRIRQVLVNIIGNAVKFTQEGGVKVSVSASLQDRNVDFSIAVIDSGVGILQEHRARLFQPFSQADNTMTRKYGGTGLGLVLSSRLAAALGGEISLKGDHAQEKGCTFVIKFVAKLPTPLTSGQETSSERGEAEANGKSRLSGIKILVADDSTARSANFDEKWSTGGNSNQWPRCLEALFQREFRSGIHGYSDAGHGWL